MNNEIENSFSGAQCYAVFGDSKRENVFKTSVNIYNSTWFNTEHDFFHHKQCCESQNIAK